MRMWMVPAKILCKDHLLGEHGELHKHFGRFHKHCQKIDGYIQSNAIEPLQWKKRHDELALEMIARGYNHNSPMTQPDFSYLLEFQINFKIDVDFNLLLLTKKCKKCKENFNNLKQGKNHDTNI